MAIPFQAQVGPLTAADADLIATSQTPLAAGNLTLTGVQPDAARRIVVSCAGSDAARTFTIYGTNRTGNSQTESVAGSAASTSVTTQDFLTVTRVAVDAATAGAIEVGTSAIASSSWYAINEHTTPVNVGVGVVVSGTVNFTVEVTYDNVNSPYTSTFPTVFSVTALASKTANTDAIISTPFSAMRVTLNSNTNPGYVRMIAIQAGLGFGN